MTSGQAALNRLREEVRKLFTQQTAALEEEFRTFQGQIASSLAQINLKLGLLRNADLPISTEALLIEETQRKDQEMTFLAHFAHEMLQKETQEEILTLLLEGAHRFAPRVALFVARGDQFLGWNSRGFSHSIAQQLSQASLNRTESPLLAGALKSDGLDSAADISGEKALLRVIRAEAPAPWHAFPLKAIQRPVAVLLAAPESGHSCKLESLSVVMDISGLRLENLALKILQEVSTPPLAAPPEPRGVEPVFGRAEEAAPPVKHYAPPPVEEAVEEPYRAEAPPLSAATSRAAQAPIPPPAWETQEPEKARQEFPEVETAREAPAAAEAAAPLAPISDEDLYDESRELTEEQKMHAQARRFARLLVSEIKLYNEQRVAEGRNHKDIYLRLKRDIDKSREMYSQRIAQDVARKFDYFHDELIRILGDNDPSALGSDYPGPQVGS